MKIEKIIQQCLKNYPDFVNAEYEIRDSDTSTFDKTYLEFLDEQIDLNARGDEWSNILKQRRESLNDYCDRKLISCHIIVNGILFCIRIDVETNKIIYVEDQSC